MSKASDNAGSSLSLVAPVTGVMVPIEDLPDPVFAQKLIGDGIAIDPTGSVLLAPCAATVTKIHRARHAITLQTPALTLLLHVGLDTVGLEGHGFKVLVNEGDVVSLGQPLLSFDLDAIAQAARSALTELVVTDGGGPLSFKRVTGRVRAGEDEVARVTVGDNGAATSTEEHELVRVDQVLIRNSHGLHARPAARLAHHAKQFAAKITVHKESFSARATSVSDLMALDIRHGDRISLSASGADASAALSALTELIDGGLGESLNSAAPPAPVVVERRFESTEPSVLGGVAASPGLAIGVVRTKRHELPAFEPTAESSAAELSRLEQAIAAVQKDLVAQKTRFERNGEAEKAQIFDAHAELLGDGSIVDDASRELEGGASAPAAFQQVIEQRRQALLKLDNPLMRHRASDIQDVGHQVMRALLGVSARGPLEGYSMITIMVCDDLALTELAQIEPSSIGGLVTAGGGASSHAAIIARALGVPYVAAVGDRTAELIDGMQVIVDGDRGFVRCEPTPSAIATALREIGARKTARKQALLDACRPAATRDGHKVEVGANIGNSKDAVQAVENGCDGVGLLRSEFLFLNRRDAPSETEQREHLERIAQTLGSARSLLVRTLDVGGDKPLAYLPQPAEENPFLGVRGVRFSLRYPELFGAQLRAILASAKHTRLRVMFPMVAKLDELQAAKRQLLDETQALGLEPGSVELGVMVEVPAAAVLADVLAREVDFFSIGTNDLTQYTLAMDRGHPQLAAQADQLDPSVLRLIKMTVEAAHAQKKWVGMCGGLAAEMLAVPLLLGLELDELSVPPLVIPDLKTHIRRLDFRACQALARVCLRAETAHAVRSLLGSFARDDTTFRT